MGTITRREQQAIKARSNQQPTRTASYAPGQLAPIFNNAVEGVDVYLEPDQGKTSLERGVQYFMCPRAPLSERSHPSPWNITGPDCHQAHSVPGIIVPLLSRQLLAPPTGSSFHERLFPNSSSTTKSRAGGWIGTCLCFSRRFSVVLSYQFTGRHCCCSVPHIF